MKDGGHCFAYSANKNLRINYQMQLLKSNLMTKKILLFFVDSGELFKFATYIPDLTLGKEGCTDFI